MCIAFSESLRLLYIQKWIDLLKDVANICTNNILLYLYYCILLFKILRGMTAYIYLMNEWNGTHYFMNSQHSHTKYKNGVTNVNLRNVILFGGKEFLRIATKWSRLNKFCKSTVSTHSITFLERWQSLFPPNN